MSLPLSPPPQPSHWAYSSLAPSQQWRYRWTPALPIFMETMAYPMARDIGGCGSIFEGLVRTQGLGWAYWWLECSGMSVSLWASSCRHTEWPTINPRVNREGAYYQSPYMQLHNRPPLNHFLRFGTESIILLAPCSKRGTNRLRLRMRDPEIDSEFLRDALGLLPATSLHTAARLLL